MKSSFLPKLESAAVLGLGLFLLPVVGAHGDDMDMDMNMDANAAPDPHSSDHHIPVSASSWEIRPSYCSHSGHASLMYGHIALMILSWVIVLPVAVMLSLARSKFTASAQLLFLALNAIGVLLSVVYNHQTPDLYPGNAHHKIGWTITWVVTAQVTIGLICWVARAVSASRHERISASGERQSFIPPSPRSPSSSSSTYRDSQDSERGTESRPEYLHSSPSSSVDEEEGLPMPNPDNDYGGFGNRGATPLVSFLRREAPTSTAAWVAGSRVWHYVSIIYSIIDRIILPFGFVTLATGLVTYARFFDGHAIYGGLAHWIKGGVFLWLGLCTLGRWSGSFANLGWAWNLPAKEGKWRPTSEFVESFLICFYGCTNVFLEHLGNSKGDWTASQLEHLSITVLFIGGGACGMLIESTWIRELLNTTARVSDDGPRPILSDEERETREPPKTDGFSMNPMPALIVLLLGIMMSSHKQDSMVSTMVHKQWGNLLAGASFARAFTYVLIFLKPPKSVLPSRPPTELLVSFGLISGGILFMASSVDCVRVMEVYELDEMMIYTLTMGFVGLLMAWELVVLALKGWAVRREVHAKRSA